MPPPPPSAPQLPPTLAPATKHPTAAFEEWFGLGEAPCHKSFRFGLTYDVFRTSVHVVDDPHDGGCDLYPRCILPEERLPSTHQTNPFPWRGEAEGDE